MGLPLRSRCSTGVQGHFLTDEDAVLSHLVVSVRRDLDFPALDEVCDSTKGIAHVVLPFTWLLAEELSVGERSGSAAGREAARPLQPVVMRTLAPSASFHRWSSRP